MAKRAPVCTLSPVAFERSQIGARLKPLVCSYLLLEFRRRDLLCALSL